MMLDQDNQIAFELSTCGEYMWTQHYENGEWSEESPMDLELARRMWVMWKEMGFKRTK